MGAWSEENFGNDDAGDWIWELEKSKGLDTLLSPLKKVLSNDGYIESPDCCEALAAAEVVASGISGDKSSIPEEARKWLGAKQGLFGKKPQIGPEHGKIAFQVVTRILESSELKELWEETEDYEKWREIQNQLLDRLSNA